MRCGRCGNENSESNRFCGMCGAPLVANTQASGVGRATPEEAKAEAAPAPRSAETRIPSNAARSATEAVPAPAERHAAPVNSSPVITGPSFLGLNKPADGRSGDQQGSHHGHGRGNDSWGGSSRNVDYLLEDDEDEPKRGWGKLAAVVIALALVAGFGYLRWKQGGFDWLTNDRKPAAAQPSQNPADSATVAGAAASPTATTPSPVTPDGASNAAAPAAGAAPASGTDASTQPATAPGVSPSTAAPSTAAPSSSAPAGTAATTPSQSAVPANPPPDASAGKPTDSGSTENSQAPAADSEAPANIPPPAVSSKPRVREPKPTPATPVDTTAEAERYIYGRGVRQDCDRGVRLLKTAAGTNLKAMISMGVLYSTGTCTPRDLPTAYLWFARALHKQPDNQVLQDDLQKLWGQMTQPERQLAIKLSQ
ncbi:MAG TPA: zinc-ribbon domain-containing protein [Candidatus Sulfotelmatobacter sp.]|nr:zinc-ribbon domain-containing protein [Candidatus Sulfotelmatobacter sp.]